MKKAIVILAVSILGGGAAGSQTPPDLGCPLKAEYLSIQEGCARGDETPDTCTWIAFFEDLTAGRQRDAEQKLAAAFDLPAEAAARVAIASLLFTIELADDACPTENGMSLFSRALGPAMVQEMFQPNGSAGAAITLRLLSFDSAAMQKMASALGQFGEGKGARTIDSLYAFLVRSGLREKFMQLMSNNPMLMTYSSTGAIPPATSSYSLELDTFADALAEVDDGLEMVGKGEVEAGRAAIEHALAASAERGKGLAAGRAGWGFWMLFRFEDALSMFARAKSWLAIRSPDDEISRHALYVSMKIRKFIVEALEIPDGQPDIPADPNLEPLLKVFDKALADLDPIAATQVIPTISQGIATGTLKKEHLLPFMVALQAIIPGVANFHRGSPPVRETGDSLSDTLPFFGELEKMLGGDEAGAVEIWEGILRENSHLSQLVPGVVAADLALKNGDLEQARKILIRSVELVERQLATLRVEPVTRQIIDKFGATLYRMAADLSGATGRPNEAFQLAERGRAFTLRRLMGESHAAHSVNRLSSEEENLLRQIAELGSAPAQGSAPLKQLYRRFEDARLDRLLEAARGVAPPFPMPVSFETLQNDVLVPGETLLAYHSGADGRLMLWRITHSAAELTMLAQQQSELLHCLTQSLRWQQSKKASRQRGQHRGVELLLDCPLQGREGSDPAELLFELLLSPVADRLAGNGRLILVPFGDLHEIPFAALRDPRSGRRLAELFELAIVPSADVLRTLRTRLEQRGASPANPSASAGS